MSDPLALCDIDSLANNPEPDEPFEPVPDTEWPELPEGPDPEWGRRMAFVVGRQSANPLARPSQTDATDETAGCFDWDDPGYLASLEAAA